MPLTVSTVTPDTSVRAEILALARSGEARDGAPPLSDQTLSRLREPSAVHVSVRDGATLAAYAQRDGAAVEVVAQPGSDTPLDTVLDTVLDAVLVPGATVWTHGARSPLTAALRLRGCTPVRELHQLRRPLDASHPLPEIPPPPAGVRIRPFVPDTDREAWLTVNAAAFASHPEQGRWTVADLDARIAEEWFDPAGFLLAERESDGDLLGFHWTKVHPDGGGEVYVLGMAPAAQGLGLGRVLLLAGLHHLAGRGCPYLLLYVDGDNIGADRLYRTVGFETHHTDVQWRAGSPAAVAGG